MRSSIARPKSRPQGSREHAVVLRSHGGRQPEDPEELSDDDTAQHVTKETAPTASRRPSAPRSPATARSVPSTPMTDPNAPAQLARTLSSSLAPPHTATGRKTSLAQWEELMPWLEGTIQKPALEATSFDSNGTPSYVSRTSALEHGVGTYQQGPGTALLAPSVPVEFAE
jgi:hypothetical protein